MSIDELMTSWARKPDWPAGAVMWRKASRDPDRHQFTYQEQDAIGWCEKGHHDVEALYPESLVRAMLSEAREPPDWDDLRGAAPDATGSQSSEDFIREMRDGWGE